MADILIFIIQSVVISILVSLILWILFKFSLKENKKLKRMLIGYLGVDEYLNNIFLTYHKLINQKEKIKSIIRNCVTKEYEETNKLLDKTCDELDRIIIEIVNEQAKFEKDISKK